MKRLRVLMIGLALALSGCSSGSPDPADTTAPSVRSESSPPSPTDVTTSDTSAAVAPSPELAALQDQLRQARKKLVAQYDADPSFTHGCYKPTFLLAAPSDLTGYVVRSVDVPNMMQLGVSVTVRLVDQTDPGRWLELEEQMGCFGVLPYAPRGATNIVDWHNMPGCSASAPSRSITWTLPDGSSEEILDPGGCGPTYPPDVMMASILLKGHNVDQDTLFRVFNSLRPVSA